MLKLSKGFTIIELVTVMAIIAILATVIIVNVMTNIQTAKETAIKADMRQLYTMAADYFASTGDSASFCTTANLGTVPENIVTPGSNYDFTCSDSSGANFHQTNGITPAGNLTNNACTAGEWIAYTCGLKGNSCWCVDSQGISESIASAPASGACSCPQQ